LQAVVLVFCVAGTVCLAIVCGLFGKYYGENESYIEGRAVVLKGVEPPGNRESQKSVRVWLRRYEKAMPNCLCALGRSKSEKSDSALVLCVGFTEKRGAAAACEMKPDKLPPGVTMDVSPHEAIGRQQKFVFLLSRIFSNEIVSARTGRM